MGSSKGPLKRDRIQAQYREQKAKYMKAPDKEFNCLGCRGTKTASYTE